MLFQPLLQGTMHKHEAILEQEMVVPKGLSIENAICAFYVTYIWKTVYASV